MVGPNQGALAPLTQLGEETAGPDCGTPGQRHFRREDPFAVGGWGEIGASGSVEATVCEGETKVRMARPKSGLIKAIAGEIGQMEWAIAQGIVWRKRMMRPGIGCNGENMFRSAAIVLAGRRTICDRHQPERQATRCRQANGGTELGRCRFHRLRNITRAAFKSNSLRPITHKAGRHLISPQSGMDLSQVGIAHVFVRLQPIGIRHRTIDLHVGALGFVVGQVLDERVAQRPERGARRSSNLTPWPVLPPGCRLPPAVFSRHLERPSRWHRHFRPRRPASRSPELAWIFR